MAMLAFGTKHTKQQMELTKTFMRICRLLGWEKRAHFKQLAKSEKQLNNDLKHSRVKLISTQLPL
jgi:hypothetical protein